MGPIGILCVQRTLNKGRLSGLYTGMGAAISDLFYCLLTGLGLSFVTDLIKANMSILQVGGSIILMVYAIYMIIHNPVSTVKDTNTDKDDRTRDMVTGFLFTLSNPLIIFLVIPLFARFGFPIPDPRFYYIDIILGYICIVLGAMLWWTVITYSVDKVRTHFNINSMWLINRIMGSILLLLSLYGLVMGAWDYLSARGIL
ncbi:MAG: LysE family transporter [Muribaculaceae bacterium]|nr:LysE family transporter [Muribaculaceae bacterium]